MNQEEQLYWLLVERLENWEADSRDGFSKFGISDMRLALANQIRKGDLLIFYVSSGISSFADVRRATANGARKLSVGGKYDTAFPWALSTEPVLTLERAQWVPIKGLLSSLALTRGKTNWTHMFRTSLRRMDPDDGSVIMAAMREAKGRSGTD